MKYSLALFSLLLLISCQQKESTIKTSGIEKPNSSNLSMASIKRSLKENGFQTFDYVDEKTGDAILMQQYFIAFLKQGGQSFSD